MRDTKEEFDEWFEYYQANCDMSDTKTALWDCFRAGTDTGRQQMIDSEEENELTDAARIEWMKHRNGNANLVADDCGRWAISSMGVQPLPESDGGFDEVVGITSFVEPQEWKPTIREAIDYAILQEREGGGHSSVQEPESD
jgi:hypothetical protein